MKIEAGKYYKMPLIMGPVWELDKIPAIPYPKSEVVALQYQTDAEAIAALVPDCFTPGKDPLVTVLFGYNEAMDFIGGGEYRIAGVQVAVQYSGKEDNLEGDCCLALFEDQTWPILGGREDLGIPKIYSEISTIKYMQDGHIRCEATLWGHFLFGLDVAPMVKQDDETRAFVGQVLSEAPWFGYKYIPALDGPPDANYPTVSKQTTKIDHLWMGQSGEFYFGNAGYADIGPTCLIIDALKRLPVRQVRQTIRYRGSSYLRYDLFRRLR